MTGDDSLGKKGWGKWGQTTILGREAIESAPMGRSPNPTDLRHAHFVGIFWDHRAQVSTTCQQPESSAKMKVVYKTTLEPAMTTISAAEANRHFSQVLRQVARGETLIVTSRGKPMATIAPITRQAGRIVAKRQLLARLTNQPPAGDRSWTRAELYED
jgi:prevent-host-death family protein